MKTVCDRGDVKWSPCGDVIAPNPVPPPQPCSRVGHQNGGQRKLESSHGSTHRRQTNQGPQYAIRGACDSLWRRTSERKLWR